MLQPWDRPEAEVWEGNASAGEPGGAAICRCAVCRHQQQGAREAAPLVAQDSHHTQGARLYRTLETSL